MTFRGSVIAVLAAALIVATGFATGQWTGRWHTPEQLAQSASRIASLPANMGDWHGEDVPLDERQVKMAHLAGYIQRRYRNKATNGEVTVLLMCGRPGPIAVHTPDVCFTGNGFELSDTPGRYTPEGFSADKATFALGDFRNDGSAALSRLNVLWAWTADGRWDAPARPRFTYARAPVLYKLYFVFDMQPTGRLEDDPRNKFIPLFLTEIDRVVLGAG